MQPEDTVEKSALYRSLGVGVEDLRNPDWETVERYLLDPATWPNDEISLHSGDVESWLIVVHVAHVGFMVFGIGLHEKDYFTLFDPVLGEEMTEFYYAGEGSELPRFAFVSEVLMLRTMRFFYETGRRDDGLCWWRDDELYALCNG